MGMAFKNEGDFIYLIGEVTPDINCSEYLYSYCGVKNSTAPYFDLDKEYAMQQALQIAIREKMVNSAHDISDGGLFVTLAESAMAANLGFEITTNSHIRKDAYLFGEGQGRVVVSVTPALASELESFFAGKQVPITKIGKVDRLAFMVDSEVFMTCDEAKDHYDTALENILEG
jgi:phosphoribosylformylglycinamidine (FGAM) synthase-like enzyme